jgi:hypothetical protein
MLKLDRHAASALGALSALLLPASGALAFQDTAPTPDPGFSIFAPEAGDDSAETGPAPGDGDEPVLPAEAGPAGPWLDRETYLAVRGGRDNTVIRTRWRIETTTLEGEPLSSDQREIVIGDGYTTEPGASEDRTVHDFATGRILTRVQSLDGPVMRNTPIVAHVHRQMNTFAYYTRGGELEEVTGPGGVQFERFWIEAAMGVRLADADMQIETGEDGHTGARRSELGSEIFGFDSDGTGSPDQAALFRAWMRHNLAIHPDALAALDPGAGIPESFGFIVFSPSSPEGRRETWTRLSANEGETAFPWPENIPPAPAEGYEVSDPAVTRLLAAGLDAIAAPDAARPTDSTFIAAAQAAQRRADHAGAYLALQQAEYHAGPCRPQSDRALCTRKSQITAAGIGNTGFETLAGAMAHLEDDPAAALAVFRTHLHREAFAGAAANMLAARSVAALRADDAGAAPDLDPLALFAASAEDDPHAPLTYWHAGRYAASIGDVESAWLLFDIARGLVASDVLTIDREARAMHEQLRTLAPGFFGPAAQR